MATYKFLTYKSNTNKAAWLFWHNTYVLAFDGELSHGEIEYFVDLLFNHEYYLHFDVVQFEGCMVSRLLDGSTDESTPTGDFVVWRNGTQRGQRVSHSETYYRWALMVEINMPYGTERRICYHGAINGDDLVIDDKGRITLISYSEFNIKIADSYNNNYGALWSHLVVPIGGSGNAASAIYTPAGVLYGARPSDIHAATRARNRAPSKGVEAFYNYFKLLRAIYTATELSRNEVGLQDHYIFEQYYYNSTAALGSMAVDGERISQYLQAAYIKDGQEQPPVSRFGETGASIVGPLEAGKTFAHEPLDQLKLAHHPVPNVDGRNYISPGDLQPYVDAGDEWRGKLSSGLDFDWFNVNAYPRTGEEEVMRKKPDIIELAL